MVTRAEHLKQKTDSTVIQQISKMSREGDISEDSASKVNREPTHIRTKQGAIISTLMLSDI